jgi:hypothetical protein
MLHQQQKSCMPKAPPAILYQHHSTVGQLQLDLLTNLNTLQPDIQPCLSHMRQGLNRTRNLTAESARCRLTPGSNNGARQQEPPHNLCCASPVTRQRRSSNRTYYQPGSASSRQGGSEPTHTTSRSSNTGWIHRQNTGLLVKCMPNPNSEQTIPGPFCAPRQQQLIQSLAHKGCSLLQKGLPIKKLSQLLYRV